MLTIEEALDDLWAYPAEEPWPVRDAWLEVRVYFDEIQSPQPQIEPARRPPSWYPGQPDPPRVRVDRCSCVYIRHYASYPIDTSRYRPTQRVVVATGFVIDEQCTHHGLVALDHDEYP